MHKISNLLERHTGIILVIALALIGWQVVEGKQTATTANNTARLVRASSVNQVVNRAQNVESWCTGINQGRDFSRHSVAKKAQAQVKVAVILKRILPVQDKKYGQLIADYLQTAIPYTLPDLNCEEKIVQTLASAKKKTQTKGQYPLVEKALHDHKAAR